MPRRNPVPSTERGRKRHVEAVATWALVVLLGWVLVRLVLALARDFWVFVIALSQP
ncbi:hypothetical protein [Sphingomonas sp. UNC305MFCol5.2]|uniref:hypothetical protein n=1 Tax=Sphingomonas sp. UNC305MFCol5.2 TaxID=1449076 RepID=UPI0012DF092F|nr:hypothetical protein [Sphingomonas sp. UNC305MFCol5.2]